MGFVDCIARLPVTITEGAVIERLRRDTAGTLEPHVLNAALIYDEQGRTRLGSIYRSYLAIGRDSDLPMIVFTPTWRANPERCAAAGLAGRDVNGDGFRFLAAIRAEYGAYAGKVWIGGLTGCRGDAYDSTEALSENEATEFHRPQLAALAAAGVDFLMAATLPAASEALGIARAMAERSLPYFLSFVIRPTGTLLDETPLDEMIAQVDRGVSPPPLGYWVNCVHPTVFAAAMERITSRSSTTMQRIVGLQGNTSRRTPEELDGCTQLDPEEPEEFARDMLGNHRRYGTRILGGCCGTDARHIAAIAAAVPPAD